MPIGRIEDTTCGLSETLLSRSRSRLGVLKCAGGLRCRECVLVNGTDFLNGNVRHDRGRRRIDNNIRVDPDRDRMRPGRHAEGSGIFATTAIELVLAANYPAADQQNEIVAVPLAIGTPSDLAPKAPIGLVNLPDRKRRDRNTQKIISPALRYVNEAGDSNRCPRFFG